MIIHRKCLTQPPAHINWFFFFLLTKKQTKSSPFYYQENSISIGGEMPEETMRIHGIIL